MSTELDAPETTSEKKKRRGMVPMGERLAYIIGSGSHFTAHFFISAFLATYLLMIGIPPAISAAVVLVLRVWDAANDLLFGYLVDRVRLNGGKNPVLRWLFRGRYLPWYRIAAFILPIAMIVTFTVNTDAPIWLRIVQYAIGYMLYDFAYTLSSTPYGAMLNTLTNDNNERTTLQSYSALGQIVSNLPVLILGTLMIAGSWGYAGSATLFAFWGVLLAIPAMFALKERNVAITEPEPGEAEAEAEHGFRQMLRFLRSTPELLFLVLAILVLGLTATGGAYSLFIGFYIFDNAALASLIGLIAIVPTLLLIPLLPPLFKRVDKVVAIRVAGIVGVAAGIGLYSMGVEGAPANLGLFIALEAVKGTCLILILLATQMLLPDIAETGRFRTGTDHTAMVWASYGFANKFGTSVVSSLSLLILAAYGFVSVEAGSFEELAEMQSDGVALQTDTAIQGLWDVSHLYPTIGLAITCVFFFFVKIRRRDIATMAAANSGEITLEEAKARLN